MKRVYATAEEAARIWSGRSGWTKESAITGGWSGLAGRLRESGDIYQCKDGWLIAPKASS